MGESFGSPPNRDFLVNLYPQQLAKVTGRVIDATTGLPIQTNPKGEGLILTHQRARVLPNATTFFGSVMADLYLAARSFHARSKRSLWTNPRNVRIA